MRVRMSVCGTRGRRGGGGSRACVRGAFSFPDLPRERAPPLLQPALPQPITPAAPPPPPSPLTPQPSRAAALGR